jgi:hypothetical protein
MIDESLLKSNFLGRDGFRWWIGQIPPLGAHGDQVNGGGWGNRYRVRIMGYHPYNTVELPDEDLPYAQCLIPTTAGSGAANVATDVKLQPGDVVFGFFLDGDNAQIPVIMGCFGRTSQVPSGEYAGPFQAFTGYTDKIKRPNGTLADDQSNESNARSQKSPRHVSPQQAKAIGDNEVSYFSAIGDVVQLASTGGGGSSIDKISTEVSNFIKKAQNLISVVGSGADYAKKILNREIDRITNKISSIMSGMVNGVVNDLYNKLQPILTKGLELLYRKVYAIVYAATLNGVAAHLAGVAAQRAMIAPVKFLQDQVPCVANKIVEGISSTVKSILTSVVDNVTNFVSCVGEQFVGSLVNDVISRVSSGLSSAIGGVQKILQFFGGFSVGNVVRSGISGLAGLANVGNCNRTFSKFSGVDQWIIGSGPKNKPPTPLEDILKVANEANALAQSAFSSSNDIDKLLNSFSIFGGTPTASGKCDPRPPSRCSAPVINIFGGSGSGASAVPIFGSIVGQNETRTGSIIGVKVTNRGSGYTFPPFVEIIDNCSQGYGAVAKSIINDKGEVEAIYIVSEGENYPINEIQPQYVSDVIILDPGEGYTKGDTAFDNFGNNYELDIFGGAIIGVRPLNRNEITDFPDITIRGTGTGALLRPNLDTEFSGEVKQVIDCITK